MTACMRTKCLAEASVLSNLSVSYCIPDLDGLYSQG